ncbi:MAG TPA: hypothetical protein VJ085_06695, partial [Candidatus Acidoferrales bacterium]|nr:hypothetical protein [Candidatus Acidoferrales bacterium]
MTDILKKTTMALDRLGIRSGSAVSPLFAELQKSFDTELAQATDSDAWKELRDRWLSRKKGVLTQIKNHWLQPAGAELKPEVGKHLNALRARVEGGLEERRAEIEPGAAAGAAEALDLTLPG